MTENTINVDELEGLRANGVVVTNWKLPDTEFVKNTRDNRLYIRYEIESDGPTIFDPLGKGVRAVFYHEVSRHGSSNYPPENKNAA